jgi:hypothetical protein
MTVILKNKTEDGEHLEAVFLPGKGMNLSSYKKGSVEVIAQQTKKRFEERFGGLGPIIGPHFHHRYPPAIPAIKSESEFPHALLLKKEGVSEPFSHGVGRYAPWQVQADENKFSAKLTGKDPWNGIPLASLEGQNFTMTYEGEMTPAGLKLDLSIVSETDSLVGIHFYYNLPNGKGKVSSQIQKYYLENGVRKALPEHWNVSPQQMVSLNMEHPLDHTLYPFPNPLEGKIVLETEEYILTTSYNCISQENCWQLFHPKNENYVCIEPISAQDPHHPNLTVSRINIRLEIM